MAHMTDLERAKKEIYEVCEMLCRARLAAEAFDRATPLVWSSNDFLPILEKLENLAERTRHDLEQTYSDEE